MSEASALATPAVAATAPEAPPVVEARGLTKRYGAFVAFDELGGQTQGWVSAIGGDRRAP